MQPPLHREDDFLPSVGENQLSIPRKSTEKRPRRPQRPRLNPRLMDIFVADLIHQNKSVRRSAESEFKVSSQLLIINL